MKVVDLLKISRDLLKLLHENGISVGDYLYLPLLADYQEMKCSGDKTSYIVLMLSKKYEMCENEAFESDEETE